MAEAQKPGLLDRMVKKLTDGGMRASKALEVAKSLLPVARAGVKKELEAKATPAEPKVAKAAKGAAGSLRSDLPVLDHAGASRAALMQVMHGLSSTASYIVAAVKGEDGIIAVRKFSDNSFKMKFYPTMRTWGYTRESLTALGADSFLNRPGKYDRMMFTKSQMEEVLKAVEKQNKRTVKDFVKRLLSVASRTLIPAFDALHTFSMPNSARQSVGARY